MGDFRHVQNQYGITIYANISFFLRPTPLPVWGRAGDRAINTENQTIDLYL
jgi:hypothetical protein